MKTSAWAPSWEQWILVEAGREVLKMLTSKLFLIDEQGVPVGYEKIWNKKTRVYSVMKEQETCENIIVVEAESVWDWARYPWRIQDQRS